jgi:hypothetical protein
MILHQPHDVTGETLDAPGFGIVEPDIVGAAAEKEVVKVYRRGSDDTVAIKVIQFDIVVAAAELVVIVDHF